MTTRGIANKRRLEKSPYAKLHRPGANKTKGQELVQALARARELRRRMLDGEQIDHRTFSAKMKLKNPRDYKPRSKLTGFHKDMERFTEACATGRSHW